LFVLKCANSYWLLWAICAYRTEVYNFWAADTQCHETNHSENKEDTNQSCRSTTYETVAALQILMWNCNSRTTNYVKKGYILCVNLCNTCMWQEKHMDYGYMRWTYLSLWVKIWRRSDSVMWVIIAVTWKKTFEYGLKFQD
jgi:hypothetical protein